MGAPRMEQVWEELDQATQEWLKANPGCVVLPRTVTAAVNRATNGKVGEAEHGHVLLTPEDSTFIKSRAQTGPAGRPVPPVCTDE